MPGKLLIVILCVSLLTVFFVFRKIRKSQFVIEDTIFWLIFSLLLIVFSVFPKLTFSLSTFLGFESPSNFLFVVFIFLLLIKVFLLSVKISKLETKLGKLVQKYAIDKKEENE